MVQTATFHVTNQLNGYPNTGVAVRLLTCADRVHLLDVLLQIHAGLFHNYVVFLHKFCSQKRAFGAYSLASRWCYVTGGQPDTMLLICRQQGFQSK